MVAITSHEHPWAERKAVTLGALGREPLILREPGSAGRQIVGARCARPASSRAPSRR
jgi:DNA-binding transcriptional LysR family regulator